MWCSMGVTCHIATQSSDTAPVHCQCCRPSTWEVSTWQLLCTAESGLLSAKGSCSYACAETRTLINSFIVHPAYKFKKAPLQFSIIYFDKVRISQQTKKVCNGLNQISRGLNMTNLQTLVWWSSLNKTDWISCLALLCFNSTLQNIVNASKVCHSVWKLTLWGRLFLMCLIRNHSSWVSYWSPWRTLSSSRSRLFFFITLTNTINLLSQVWT